MRLFAFSGIDHNRNLTVFDGIDDMWATLIDFVDALTGDTGFGQDFLCT